MPNKNIRNRLSALGKLKLMHIIMMLYATGSPKVKRRIIRLIGVKHRIKRHIKSRKAKKRSKASLRRMRLRNLAKARRALRRKR